MPGLAKSIQQYSGTKTVVPAFKGGKEGETDTMPKIQSKKKGKVQGLSKSEGQHSTQLKLRTWQRAAESDPPPAPPHRKKKTLKNTRGGQLWMKGTNDVG